MKVVTTDIIKDALRDVLKVYEKHYLLQGHKDTGALIEEAVIAVTPLNDGVIGELLLNYYFEFLERRLSPENVPFSPGSGKRHSKLIAALQRYFKRKGLSDKEALNASFGTATTWKKGNGRPSKGSYKYSKNGKRLGVLRDTLAEIDSILDAALDKLGERYISQIFSIFDKLQQK